MNNRPRPTADELAWQVVRRESSLWEMDISENRVQIADALRGRRILVVGGGGTIGSMTFRRLLRFAPAVVNVIDANENYLAELTRHTRASSRELESIDLRFWPVDYTSAIAERILENEEPYDFVLNFAALKHVRSEKDIYSLLQMIHTNVIGQWRFKRSFVERAGSGRFFGVSTDKAANPTSIMGATKRLMEDVLFDTSIADRVKVSSARFANVAYSNGSLLQAWLQRIDAGQPVAVPRGTRRYFVHPEEAGDICLLAATLADTDEILFPRLDPESELQLLEDIAGEMLERCGYRPVLFEDEQEAKAAVAHLRAEGAWPLLLTPLDTSGEKPYEEFVGDGEETREKGLRSLLAVVHRPSGLSEPDLKKLGDIVSQPKISVTKPQLADLIGDLIPNFRHVETGRSLDARI